MGHFAQTHANLACFIISFPVVCWALSICGFSPCCCQLLGAGTTSSIFRPRTGETRCGNWNNNNKKPWKNKPTLNTYCHFLFLQQRRAKGSWLLSAVLPFVCNCVLGNRRPLDIWFGKPLGEYEVVGGVGLGASPRGPDGGMMTL